MQTIPSKPSPFPDHDPCPCGSGLPFASCCGPYLQKTATPPTAEALMRSRYTAFVIRQFSYLQQTVPPKLRDTFDPDRLAEETASVVWLGLHIDRLSRGTRNDTSGEVEYSARYSDNGQPGVLREKSSFLKQNGTWYYVNGIIPPRTPVVRTEARTGRNDPCPCGSGKKYKKCCGT